MATCEDGYLRGWLPARMATRGAGVCCEGNPSRAASVLFLRRSATKATRGRDEGYRGGEAINSLKCSFVPPQRGSPRRAATRERSVWKPPSSQREDGYPRRWLPGARRRVPPEILTICHRRIQK